MQQSVNDRGPVRILAREIKRTARRVLPLLLVPCVPTLVAFATASLPVHAQTDADLPDWAKGKGAPPPLLLRPLSQSDAVALNRRIPFSTEHGPAADPLGLIKDEIARARALECLTSAIYYESASESAEGQAAVAQVILNRVRHPAFPASVCAVIYQGSTLRTGCQFSYTCDGSLQRVPSRRVWEQARAVAEAALSGAVYAPVGLATHYHTDQVVPYWAPSLAKSIQVGAHIFYRWAGGAGRPKGFTQRYSGAERDPLTLRGIALLSHNIWPSIGELSTKPRLSLTIDPDAELNGIVRLLANAPADAAGGYEKAIRAHFASDTAQPLFRRLSGGDEQAPAAPSAAPVALAEDPKTLDDKLLAATAAIRPPSLDQLIREFGREMRVTTFLRTHRRLYKASAEQAQQLAERAAVDWEIYSGVPVQGRKAVLSLSQGLSICPAPASGKVAGHVIRWPADPRNLGPAEIFMTSGFAADSLVAVQPVNKRKARQLRDAIEPIEDQIVAAVFARIAMLSRGPDTGRAMMEREVAAGRTLVPVLAERLRFYERHRNDYPTLNHFLPKLVAGIAPAKPQLKSDDPAKAHPACSQAPNPAS